MKLLINVDLEIYGDVPSDVIDSIKEICEKFSVWCKEHNPEEQLPLVIMAQKVVLDEYDMNELFYEVISNVDMAYKTTRYGALGSAGCDFTVVIDNC